VAQMDALPHNNGQGLTKHVWLCTFLAITDLRQSFGHVTLANTDPCQRRDRAKASYLDLAQVCIPSLPPLYTVEHLYIRRV
jgi:hypothetical protein